MLLGRIKSHNARSKPAPSPLDQGLAFTVRFAFPDDGDELRRLAAYDSQRPLSGRVIVAEVDGRLWAAVGLEERRGIADPFHQTAALVELLLERADRFRDTVGVESSPQRALRPAFF
jgi:hypothetical protein